MSSDAGDEHGCLPARRGTRAQVERNVSPLTAAMARELRTVCAALPPAAAAVVSAASTVTSKLTVRVSACSCRRRVSSSWRRAAASSDKAGSLSAFWQPKRPSLLAKR